MSRIEYSYGIGAVVSVVGLQMIDNLLNLPYIGWNLYAVVMSGACGIIVGTIAGKAMSADHDCRKSYEC